MIRFDSATGTYRFNPKDVFGKPGKFSTLYTGVRESDGLKVVIKALREDAPEELPWPVNHEVFVYELDRIQIHGRTIIVRPFILGRTIDDWARTADIRREQNFETLLQLLLSITQALQQLHTAGYIHGDIRRHNLLVSQSPADRPRARIIDAGLLRKFRGTDRESEFPFSLLYSPPEQVLRCRGLDGPHTDWYSLALCIYEILSGEPPFQTSNPELLIHLMCVKPLAETKRIHADLFQFLRKATNRYPFPKPPGMYEREELYELLKIGIRGRFQSGAEFESALRANWRQPEPKKGLFRFLQG